MKKRFFSCLLALCLALSLLSTGALAKEYSETEVSTADELVRALPGGEGEPVPAAKMNADITVDSEHSIATMGKLIVPSGCTLTIGDCAVLEAQVVIEAGGAVVVESGGYFGTTMGDDTENNGSITVKQGAQMKSTMGASIVNKGSLTLDGTFYCGCVNYDSADHLWFSNSDPAAVTGRGEVILYDAGAGDSRRPAVDLDAMIGAMMDLLGQVKRFGDGYWDDVGIYKQVDLYGDSAYSDLADAYNAVRTIKGETVEGNMDTILVLHEKNVVIPAGVSLRGMINLIVDAGASLDIFGSLETGMELRPARTEYEYNEETDSEVAVPLDPASVTVEPFGSLSTTMGGPIVNDGSLTVMPSGVLESQMGGEIFNYADLILGGLCYVGGFYNTGENIRGVWFSSNGTVKPFTDEEGGKHTGHIVVKRVVVQRPGSSDETDTLDDRIAAAAQLKTQITGANTVPVYTTAVSFAEMQDLNEDGRIDGIYLNGTKGDNEDDKTIPGMSYGIRKMGISDESLKSVAQIHVTESLTLAKPLCVDWAELIVEKGCTLTLPSLNDLSFSGRRTRIVVEAAGLNDTAGGTLAIGGTKVISGDAAENAVLTVKANIMSLGPAEWAMLDYPTDRNGEWYYVHSTDTVSGAVDAKGALTEDTLLPLLADGPLNITGAFTHDGSVEIRDELNVSPGATANIRDLNYGTDSAENTIRGVKSTTFELEFDLNTGNGYEDRIDHLAYDPDEGMIYLEENEVPITPVREGYVFLGWKAASGWTAASAGKLDGFTVKQDASGRWCVPVPKAFPVLMEARWLKLDYAGSTIQVEADEKSLSEPICVLAATYQSGRMLDCQTVTLSEPGQAETLTLRTTGDSVKLFAVSPEGFRPLCPAVTL